MLSASAPSGIGSIGLTGASPRVVVGSGSHRDAVLDARGGRQFGVGRRGAYGDDDAAQQGAPGSLVADPQGGPDAGGGAQGRRRRAGADDAHAKKRQAPSHSDVRVRERSVYIVGMPERHHDELIDLLGRRCGVVEHYGLCSELGNSIVVTFDTADAAKKAYELHDSVSISGRKICVHPVPSYQAQQQDKSSAAHTGSGSRQQQQQGFVSGGEREFGRLKWPLLASLPLISTLVKPFILTNNRETQLGSGIEKRARQ